jgi:uncharacterized protein YcfL
MKKNLLFLLVFFMCIQAHAQQTVWGYIRDSVTNEPVELASVTNTSHKSTVITNNQGLFKINIVKNDVLTVSAVGYRYYTVVYNGLIAASDTIQLYLIPISRNLNNVTVKNSGVSQYTLDSLERNMEFKEAMISPPVKAVELANSGAGFGISLNRLSKKEKSKRKATELFNNSEKEAYINYRFSLDIVTRYSGLKNEALQSFVQRHRPSYEWLRKHPKEEDIKYYINEKLKEDRARKK